MEQNFSTTFSVVDSPAEVMEAIGNVAGWWATNNSGRTKKVGDSFTVRFGKTFSTIQVIEFIHDKKLVWFVTDCDLPLFADPKEWLHTKLVWEVSFGNGKTEVRFTHEGLTPGKSCYEDCKKGWTYYARESLQKLITEGKGMPGTGIFCYAIVHERKYEGLLYFKSDPIPDYPEGFIYADVLTTRGEQVTGIKSVHEYRSKNFVPQHLQGDYFMILENKPIYQETLPLEDLTKHKIN